MYRCRLKSDFYIIYQKEMKFIIKRSSDNEYEEEKEIGDLDELIAYLQEGDINLSFDRDVNGPTGKIQLLIED